LTFRPVKIALLGSGAAGGAETVITMLPAATARAAKDAGLVVDAARAAGADLPLPALVHDQMAKAIEAGHGDEDMSATFLASCREP
jgi:hypothetical protein